MPVNHAKIKALRGKKGLSLEQAARQAGLADRQHWYKIESGLIDDVKLSTLERMAKALGVKASDLLK